MSFASSLSSVVFEKNSARVAGAFRFVGIKGSLDQLTFKNNKAEFYGNDSLDDGCVLGETKLEDDTCEECPAGKYSLSFNATICTPCND